MSSPLRRLALLSICLFTCFSSLLAQPIIGGPGFRPVQLDLDFDLSMPMDPDVRVPFHFGGGAGLGVRLALTGDQKIWLTPLFSVKSFGKHVGKDGDHDIEENLDMLRLGLQLEYRLTQLQRSSLLAFARVDHNWVSNYFSEEYNYDYLTGTSTTIKSKDYLKGNGLSYDLGLKWQFSRWYVKAHYEFMKTSMRVNKDVVNEALQAGLIVPDYHSFDFSTINIGGGFIMNLKRRRR